MTEEKTSESEKSPVEETPQAIAKVCKRIVDETSERFGLIDGFAYNFDESGFIDWRSIIPSKFLCVNAKKFKDAKKDVPKSTEGLEDSDIIIKLGGIKWLARLRGYEKVSFEVVSSEKSVGQLGTNVVVKCMIDWIPNFENPLGFTYEEVASCAERNADEDHLRYSESIAANRAFVRCVRNSLNVNIVGEEEVFEKADEPQKNESQVAIDPQHIFLKICKDKGMNFSQILDFCENNGEKDIKSTVDTEEKLLKYLTPKASKILLRKIKKQ